MITLKALMVRLFRGLPRSRALYGLFKSYVDQFNGEENVDPETNGEYRFLRNNLGTNSIVFDIGANVGEWTNTALALNSAIEVHCFEPNRAAYACLTSKTFTDAKVVCNNFGLSNHAGVSDLYVFGETSGLNSLYRRAGLEPMGIATPMRAEQIQLETYDSYSDRNGIGVVDFCKIDVEGHELAVLEGMVESLRGRKIKVIQFEYGGTFIDSRTLLKDIFDFVADLDYQLYKILPDSLVAFPGYDQRVENFHYQNWLAVLKGHPFRP